jgi:hypothetical protein
VKVFLVTHLYHFASGFFAQKLDHASFLRAERLPDGTRPFRLIEAGPLQTSYGEDLYKTVFAEAERASSSQESTENLMRQESSSIV